MQIGLEIEYWTLDSNGNLATPDEQIVACEDVEQEFVAPLIEVKTPPCDTVDELLSVFADRMERVLEVASHHNKRLVPLGTPLTEECIPRRNSTRTDIQQTILGIDLTHANHCAGTHIHFEQQAVLDQLRVLTAIDPAFALVATTPFYRGSRIAACARPQVYRRRCYQKLPSYGQLWRYPASVSEWRDRLTNRFERFVALARDAGIDRPTVTDHFSPADAVWSPVRLRDDLGTVEWRAPDAVTPLELTQLVADVTRLIDRACDHGTTVIEANDWPDGGGEDTVVLPPFETVVEHVDTALSQGVIAPQVEAYLNEFGLESEAYRPFSVRIGGRDRIDRNTARTIRLRRAAALEQQVRDDRSLGPDTDLSALISA